MIRSDGSDRPSSCHRDRSARSMTPPARRPAEAPLATFTVGYGPEGKDLKAAFGHALFAELKRGPVPASLI